LIAVAVFALVIGASAYAIPALAQPFWVDEADAPPGWEGEKRECPYAYQHRYENREECLYGGEPGEGHRWGGGEGSLGNGCGGSNGRGGGSHMCGSTGPKDGSGNRRGSS
jgi:hypothetical protein